MVGHGGSSAGSYLADPTSPIPSHCASIVVTSTLRVNRNLYMLATEGLKQVVGHRAGYNPKNSTRKSSEEVVFVEIIDKKFPKSLLTLKVLVATSDAQWEGMGDVGSARYEPALLPPCPTTRVLSSSN